MEFPAAEAEIDFPLICTPISKYENFPVLFDCC